MKIFLILLCFVLLSGCNQREIEIIQKNNDYTIKEIASIEGYKFDDLYQPFLCEENVVCVKGINGKYYKVDLIESKIQENEGFMEFNPIIIPNGNQRNGFIKNKIMHYLDKGQNVAKINDFRILNEINYIGDAEGVSMYKETYSYWKGNEIKVLLEFETTKENPMLPQYIYYDETNQNVFLTYPTDKNIQIYQYNNQSMEMIDTIEYKKENMNYAYSVFASGKQMHVYEDENQRCFVVDNASFTLSKDYDIQLCKNYIFAFSKYEKDKIIDYTKSKEYLFDSEFSLNYTSYWNDDENVTFMVYDTDKKIYVYAVFDQNELITYELPFKNDAVVFRMDESSYGFIVEQNRIKTIYLFNVNN